MLSIISIMFEIRYHSAAETEKNRDWRNESLGQKAERLNAKSDALNRMTRDYQVPWNRRKKVLKASMALKGAAARLLSRERKQLNKRMEGRLASRVSYGRPPTKLKPRKPRSIKPRGRAA